MAGFRGVFDSRQCFVEMVVKPLQMLGLLFCARLNSMTPSSITDLKILLEDVVLRKHNALIQQQQKCMLYIFFFFFLHFTSFCLQNLQNKYTEKEWA